MSGWWETFHHAAALRDRLHALRKMPSYTADHGEMGDIRREAGNLLLQTSIPMPLKLLLFELAEIKTDKWPEYKFRAARIESRQPSSIGYKRLTTLLREATGKDFDPARIRNWRRDPEYQRIVQQMRRTEEGD